MSNSLANLCRLLRQGGVRESPKQEKKRKLSFAPNTSSQNGSTKKIRKGTPYKINKGSISTQPIQHSLKYEVSHHESSSENEMLPESNSINESSDEWTAEDHNIYPTMSETGDFRCKTNYQKKNVNHSNFEITITPDRVRNRKVSKTNKFSNVSPQFEDDRQFDNVSNKKHKNRNHKDREKLISKHVSTSKQKTFENKYLSSNVSKMRTSNTVDENSTFDDHSLEERGDVVFNVNDASVESSDSSKDSLDSFRKSSTYNDIYNNTNNFEDYNEVEDVAMVEDMQCKEHMFYEIENAMVIVLTPNSPLYVYGAFCLNVLYGKVDVFGHKLEISSEEIEIYSPRSTSHLYLTNEFRGDNCVIRTTDLLKELLSLGIKSRLAFHIAEDLLPNDTIISCKKIFNTKISYLKTHVSQHIFPQSDDGRLDFELSADFSGKSNLLKIGGNWNQLTEFVNDTSRIMLCGGKGVGKSTLLRYLINRTLMKYPKVLVIDLDPGQPEFTVSGCVSAVVVSKPIFGPNYTHLMKPKKCIFVKNIDVAHDPYSYLECAKELVNTDLEVEPMPTLINYLGYTKGFGLKLAVEIISMVAPTHLIQIKCTKPSRNYRLQLTMNNIKDMTGLNGIHVERAINYRYIELKSMASDNDHWQASSLLTREMGIISYFSQISVNMSLTTCETTMYCIDLNKINILCDDTKCDANVANGLMVALCESGTYKNTYKCYGWGIVRGINSEKLYLLTPVSSEDLENVYYLIVGSVALPASLYMTENEKVGHVPYVSTGISTQFHQVPKRTYIPKTVNQNVA